MRFCREHNAFQVTLHENVHHLCPGDRDSHVRIHYAQSKIVGINKWSLQCNRDNATCKHVWLIKHRTGGEVVLERALSCTNRISRTFQDIYSKKVGQTASPYPIWHVL
jgi:hypothetical protein